MVCFYSSLGPGQGTVKPHSTSSISRFWNAASLLGMDSSTNCYTRLVQPGSRKPYTGSRLPFLQGPEDKS